MKLTQLVAKAMVTAGLVLPAVGLAVGVANANPLSPPPVPKPLLATAMANGNKAVPTTMATPFGSAGAFSPQPGLAIAMANSNMAVPTTTATPFTSATSIANGNMAVPTTTATPFSGGIRTRHGTTTGTSLFGIFAGRLG